MAGYSVRVIHRADTAGVPVRWANTWEVSVELGGVTLDYQALATGFRDFHLTVLRSNYFVESVVVSSLAEDGQPYNPESFGVLEVNQRGNREDGVTGGSAALPLTTCMLVKKQVAQGRSGNLLLRGVLGEEDISSDPTTGAITLVSATSYQTIISNAFNALDAVVQAVGDIALIGPGTIATNRVVTSLFVKGITVKKLNNKYFNRGSRGPLGAVERAFGGILSNAGEGANLIIQAFNALPEVPDLPLLPGA